MKKLLLFTLVFTLSLLPLTTKAEILKKIEIVGLKWTKENFVRRELLLKEGKEFSRRLLKLSIRNLLNTHLFYRVVPKVGRVDGGIKLTLKLKERFPVVPIPRLKFGSGGTYRAGFELRDYNLAGMGHKLFAGFSRWYNTSDASEKGNLYVELYRITERVTFSLGNNYYSDSVSKTYDFPVFFTYYLDPTRVNQFTFGVRHLNIKREEDADRTFNFFVLRWLGDWSTDMVYYLKGHKISASLQLAEPSSSSYFTGSVTFSACRSIPVEDLKTFEYKISVASKLGYSQELQLNSGIPGFSEEKVVNKRFASLALSYRFPLYRKNVFAEPVAVVGDSFKTAPDDFLFSAGLRIEAFWEKLVDGIISFTCYRGLGSSGEFTSTFKFGFRW